MIERPASQQHVERTAPERAVDGGIGHASPEGFERAARAFGAVLLITAHQHGGVHRAGRRAGNAFYLQPRLFQQTVEDAPCKRAMRAAALQGEVDEGGRVMRGFIVRSSQDNPVVRSALCRELAPIDGGCANQWSSNDSNDVRAAGGVRAP